MRVPPSLIPGRWSGFVPRRFCSWSGRGRPPLNHSAARLAGHYHPQYLSRLLGTFSSELGLPRLTAHRLRHTSTSLASGVPPKVAAERLGPADATLFTNLYSHVTPTMRREAAARIGEVLFGSPPS